MDRAAPGWSSHRIRHLSDSCLSLLKFFSRWQLCQYGIHDAQRFSIPPEAEMDTVCRMSSSAAPYTCRGFLSNFDNTIERFTIISSFISLFMYVNVLQNDKELDPGQQNTSSRTGLTANLLQDHDALPLMDLLFDAHEAALPSAQFGLLFCHCLFTTAPTIDWAKSPYPYIWIPLIPQIVKGQKTTNLGPSILQAMTCTAASNNCSVILHGPSSAQCLLAQPGNSGRTFTPSTDQHFNKVAVFLTGNSSAIFCYMAKHNKSISLKNLSPFVDILGFQNITS